MNLSFDLKLAEGYKSNSQKARVLTENWVLSNSYCPNCGNLPLTDFDNNKPVADFYCKSCTEEFELKSKSGKLASKITDGAYSTMLERINSANNPNFFFLTYSKNWTVDNFLIIPKQFFTEEIIIKRPPLAPTAKRAGWVGCNIDISKVTEAGRVFLIKNSKIIDKCIVSQSFKNTMFLRQKSNESKGWILDVMKCVDEIKTDEFKLDEVYNFENRLKLKYPNNNFIKDKIRQQLQILRDKEIIEFVGRGKYRKIKYGNI
ncbi:DpnI domain-containing protein [Marivirga sp.]|uniref:DpnI domain-containing protein n=1 Tax=Marivirga sp. TaxID=2018662 RepID=UPI002D7E7805|nr:DpnI domain-containing protein [Marivirga sp.]HET8860208.1 DpnI domain-containing protein [Marivirga sp.]